MSTSSTRCRGTTRTDDPGRAGRAACRAGRRLGVLPSQAGGPPAEGQCTERAPSACAAETGDRRCTRWAGGGSLPTPEPEPAKGDAVPLASWGPTRPKGRGTYSTSHSATFRPSHRRPNRSASRTTVFTSRRSGFSRCPRPPRRRRGRHVMSGLRAITYPTRNRRNGRSGSSRTVGIPVTTPTMHRATAGTRCRAATDSARAGSREQTQNARHAGVLAHFASFTLTS